MNSRPLKQSGLRRIPRQKEKLSGQMLLTSAYRRPEDVRVHAVIIAELEFRDVQRQIFPADFVEAADDPAFEDRPEPLNRIRVDRADDVLSRTVIDNRVRELFAKVGIAPI